MAKKPETPETPEVTVVADGKAIAKKDLRFLLQLAEEGAPSSAKCVAIADILRRLLRA